MLSYSNKGESLMEKFKNFFYNKNDIIVAILILTIAVFVIAFRIKSLMDYPRKGKDDVAGGHLGLDPVVFPEDVSMPPITSTTRSRSPRVTRPCTSVVNRPGSIPGRSTSSRRTPIPTSSKGAVDRKSVV